MRRCPTRLLIAAWLLAPAASYAQSVRHDNVEILDSPPYVSRDEKKPDLEAVARYIVDKTNEFREQEGRPRVAVNDRLAATARDFADYMARTGRYGHTADGNQPADRAAKHGYDYCVIAENIAYAFNSDGFTTEELGRNFVEGWKNSPGHRRNMLDPDVTETGAAVARSEKTGYYYAVQMFGRPKSLTLRFRLVNESSMPVTYRIAGQTFSLPPKYIRIHEQCRPTEVTFDLPSGGKTLTQTVKAENNAQYVIVDEGGSLRVKSG
jgi:uncharacterized protein YkwD